MKPCGQLRLSLGQLLTVPFFVAAAMACIVPAVRSNAVAYYGLVPLLFFEAILIPIVLALVAQFMLARNTGRDRLVAGLLWLSALVGRVAILLILAVTVWDLGISVLTGRGLPLDLLAFLLVLLGGLIALNEVALVLRRKVNMVRCPHCGSPSNAPAQCENSHQNRFDPVCPTCGARIPESHDEPPPRDGTSRPLESRCMTLLAHPRGS